MTIGLEYGELTSAAQTVVDARDPLQELLAKLGDDLGVSAAGFKGQAAAGLGQALTAWFEVAGTLGPVLDTYAQALIELANEHLVNDGQQVAGYRDLAGRLGGAQ